MKINKRQVGILVLWAILIIVMGAPMSWIALCKMIIKACVIVSIGLVAIGLMENGF